MLSLQLKNCGCFFICCAISLTQSDTLIKISQNPKWIPLETLSFLRRSHKCQLSGSIKWILLSGLRCLDTKKIQLSIANVLTHRSVSHNSQSLAHLMVIYSIGSTKETTDLNTSGILHCSSIFHIGCKVWQIKKNHFHLGYFFIFFCVFCVQVFSL